MISRNELLLLLDKWTLNELTSDEHNRMMAALRSGQFDEECAAHILNSLKTVSDSQDSMLPPYRSDEIVRRILSAEVHTTQLISVPPQRRYLRTTIAAAAAVLAIALLTTLYLWKQERPAADITQSNQAPNASKTQMFRKHNTSSAIEIVRLEDGSTIQMKPGSSIEYPVHFTANKREVFLNGDAFFDITKDPRRPFYVYNRNLVTHVLGTSFSIASDDSRKTLVVAVRSGKVKVFEKHNETDDLIASNALIVLPNHKVTYHESNRQFVPSIVDDPIPLISVSDDAQPAAEEPLDDFRQVLVSQLLSEMQATYGIEIIVENDNLNKCLFSGDITEGSLLNQLEIVCRALNASFEIVGTRILIRGKGCE
jgi:transmembrane sensor